MNNRRKLIIALGAGALGTPLDSFAQQQDKVWRGGYLASVARPTSFDPGNSGAFLQGMRDLGYVEGKNLVIEWRYAEGKSARLPDLASELVNLKVEVIVAGGTPATSAAQKATATIPIVMVNTGDPVGSGFVKSLAHPGENITGLSSISGDLSSKHLEMLRSMVPKLSRVAVLLNPANSSHAIVLQNIVSAAQRTSVKVLPVEARIPQEIETAFSIINREESGAVIVGQDGLFLQQRREIAVRAASRRLPSIAGPREYVEAGGLMSYGPSLADNFRRAATYVDKILKGAKVGDLPVEQPTKFELFINGKTAKTLGLTIPQSLLISAVKIIE